MRVITIANLKGGVGKTTLALNLSSGLARHGADLGWRVAVLDLCIQGNSTRALGGPRDPHDDYPDAESFALHLCTPALLKTKQFDRPPRVQDLVRTAIQPWPRNLFFLPSNLDLLTEAKRDFRDLPRDSISRALAPLRDYDYVVVDMGPGLDDLLALTLIASDFLLIPIAMDQPSINSAARIVREMNKLPLEQQPQILGVVANMVDERKIIARSTIAAARELFGNGLFDILVPEATVVTQAQAMCRDLYVYKPSDAVTFAFANITEEALRRMDRMPRLPRQPVAA